MHYRSFAFEQLEGRTLFSVIALLDDAPGADTAARFAVTQTAASVTKPFPNAFNVAGSFTHPFGNPDAGSQYLFNGTGKTTLLGSFTLTGRIQTPGLIANAQATGKLYITTSKGTIHLKLNGPSAGSLPATMSYSIYKGTGSYANAKGKGQVSVSASGSTSKFVFRFKPAVS